MNTKSSAATIAMVAVLISTASAHAAKAGDTARMTIGVVERSEAVTLDSEAGKGALVGGTLGLLSAGGKSTGKKARNTIIGVAAGSAIAGSSQGDRSARRYTVRTGTGASVAIVSDQKEIRIGDCVVVEESGSTANIRRVSQAMCETESQAAVAQIGPELQNDAAECVAAKQQLVDAQTIDQIEIASRKVRILCDD